MNKFSKSEALSAPTGGLHIWVFQDESLGEHIVLEIQNSFIEVCSTDMVSDDAFGNNEIVIFTLGEVETILKARTPATFDRDPKDLSRTLAQYHGYPCLRFL